MQLKTLPPVRVAYMRHTGPLSDGDGIQALWMRFAKWCEAQGFFNPRRPMYGVTLDNPMTTAPVACRYDVCIEVDAAFAPPPGLAVRELPGGRYATVPFHGTPQQIGAAWQRVFGRQLATSGFVPSGEPALEYYDEQFSVDASGAFPCLLCVPVRSA